MISTSATKLEHPRPEDGGLRDLDPVRRAVRVREAGVRIERIRGLTHAVHLPDGSVRRCRTFGHAERVAHTYIESQHRLDSRRER